MFLSHRPRFTRTALDLGANAVTSTGCRTLRGTACLGLTLSCWTGTATAAPVPATFWFGYDGREALGGHIRGPNRPGLDPPRPNRALVRPSGNPGLVGGMSARCAGEVVQDKPEEPQKPKVLEFEDIVRSMNCPRRSTIGILEPVGISWRRQDCFQNHTNKAVRFLKTKDGHSSKTVT